jgi:hypothetical protein
MKRICDWRLAIGDWKSAACGLAITALLLVGCATKRAPEAAALPRATLKDPATTQPSYWLDQPAVVSVENFKFQPLWDACEKVARSYQFQLDREDYRLGLITTKPTISKQILEPWRQDAGTFNDVMQDSLTTIRRSIRFEIERSEDGTYSMTPKVLVERETILERRITSAAQYRSVFSGPAVGSRTAIDEDAGVPIVYWTPIGRDLEMERHLAASVREQVKKVTR